MSCLSTPCVCVCVCVCVWFFILIFITSSLLDGMRSGNYMPIFTFCRKRVGSIWDRLHMLLNSRQRFL